MKKLNKLYALEKKLYSSNNNKKHIKVMKKIIKLESKMN